MSNTNNGNATVSETISISDIIKRYSEGLRDFADKVNSDISKGLSANHTKKADALWNKASEYSRHILNMENGYGFSGCLKG